VEMVEYVEPVDSDHIHAFKALAPLENTVQVGEDVKAGDLVLHAGQKIRPQDVGFMAGVGISAVPVFLRPKIAVISSGDEIIPVEQTTRPGEIRDINRYTISAMVRETGAIPLFVGIARDRFEQIREKVETGLKKSDMVVITGGSSVGTLDLTIDVLRSLPDTEILAHGVSVRPGKPTLLADVAGKPFLGLPGHPVSAMVIFHLFGKPIMEILAGLSRTKEDFGKKLKARASRNIPSGPGREDYIRVKLEQRNGTLWAHPVYGKSGAISSLVYAAGLMKIGVNEEGIEEGEEAEVILL